MCLFLAGAIFLFDVGNAFGIRILLSKKFFLQRKIEIELFKLKELHVFLKHSSSLLIVHIFQELGL